MFIRILRIAILIVALAAFWYIYHTPEIKEDNFIIFTTDCDNFTIIANIDYDESNIYISSLEFCGGTHPTSYILIEASLYQNTKSLDTQMFYRVDGIDLLEYFTYVRFHVENFSEICEDFNKSPIILELLATNSLYRTTSHLVEIRSQITC